ncbi:porin [Paraburkholderia hospita]|uniref:Porin n=1 Tax=Paraburkholderia hospita TaxID=169430 RepID=A0AAN1JNC8_9BURK|nr:porin [Paraburkholderia hospita]AUT76292.1 porin [Paraburkholderia hospita]SEI17885.1 Outer membrane protein (porin) [Paraburkholderia hospita]
MKAKWLAATIFASTGIAYGQSSVTLYGIVDSGVEYYNNSSTKGSFVGMPTLTGEVPSRWGLRGSEDLGSGFEAFFVLESGFALSNGTLGYGGRLFGRQANVGLSTPLGSVTVGRQMNMSMYALFDADVIGPSVHSMASFDTYLPNARSDNAVGYLGTFGGFKLGATYSFGRDAAGPVGPSATNCPGQVPGNILACRQYTMLAAYTGPQFGAAASYDVMRGGNGATAPLSSPGATDAHVIVDGYVSFGSGKVGMGWVRRNTSAGSHAQSDLFFLGGNYFFTPAFSADAQVVRYILRSHSDSTLMVGRLNYLLSKQTTLYTSVGYVINSEFGNAPVAAGGTVATGKNQFGVMLGVQHKF